MTRLHRKTLSGCTAGTFYFAFALVLLAFSLFKWTQKALPTIAFKLHHEILQGFADPNSETNKSSTIITTIAGVDEFGIVAASPHPPQLTRAIAARQTDLADFKPGECLLSMCGRCWYKSGKTCTTQGDPCTKNFCELQMWDERTCEDEEMRFKGEFLSGAFLGQLTLRRILEKDKTLLDSLQHVAGQLRENHGCFVWASGYMRIADRPGLPVPSAECDESCIGMFNGRWQGSSWLPKNENNRLEAFPTLFGSDGKLFGLRLLFVGDSMARNLFFRVISWIRKEGMTIDRRLPDADPFAFVMYSLFINGTDQLSIVVLQSDWNYSKIRSINTCRHMQDVALRIAYVSNVQSSTLASRLLSIEDICQPHHTIIMLGRWTQSPHSFARALREIQNFSSSPLSQRICVTLPLNGNRWKNMNDLEYRRQSTWNGVLRKHKAIANYTVVDFDRLVTREGFNFHFEYDSSPYHFQCGIKFFPYPFRPYVFTGRRLVGDKGQSKKLFDCTDPVNLVVSKAILQIVVLKHAIRKAL